MSTDVTTILKDNLPIILAFLKRHKADYSQQAGSQIEYHNTSGYLESWYDTLKHTGDPLRPRLCYLDCITGKGFLPPSEDLMNTLRADASAAHGEGDDGTRDARAFDEVMSIMWTDSSVWIHTRRTPPSVVRSVEMFMRPPP